MHIFMKNTKGKQYEQYNIILNNIILFVLFNNPVNNTQYVTRILGK